MLFKHTNKLRYLSIVERFKKKSVDKKKAPFLQGPFEGEKNYY